GEERRLCITWPRICGGIAQRQLRAGTVLSREYAPTDPHGQNCANSSPPGYEVSSSILASFLQYSSCARIALLTRVYIAHVIVQASFRFPDAPIRTDRRSAPSLPGPDCPICLFAIPCRPDR